MFLAGTMRILVPGGRVRDLSQGSQIWTLECVTVADVGEILIGSSWKMIGIPLVLDTPVLRRAGRVGLSNGGH